MLPSKKRLKRIDDAGPCAFATEAQVKALWVCG
jgi:hypothetical protein